MTTIHVGDRPEPFAQPATFVDGATAMAHKVTLSMDGDRLVIKGHGVAQRWRFQDIREVPGSLRLPQVLMRDGDPLARLYVPTRILDRYLMDLHRRAPSRLRKRVFGWGATALAMVALTLFVLVPMLADRLAPLIPPEGERALGQAVLTQMRTALNETGIDGELVAFCDDTAGHAAMDRLVARLQEAADPPVTMTVNVLDHEMINAFALPGNQIVFFRGFLAQAESPEEVAAVMAHEMGHLQSRDPTRSALRWGGSLGVLGLLFGDFAGGTVMVLLADQLITSRHSRAVEADADAYALDLLARAQIRPSALADFFDRMLAEHGDDGDEPGLYQHFASHPDAAARSRAARDATPRGYVGEPILSDAEWLALRGICDT